MEIGKIMYGQAALNVLNININGLRSKQKKTLLGEILRDAKAGICIITESHLREAEVDQLRIKNYHVITKYCIPIPIGEHISGGALLLVHIKPISKKLPKVPSCVPLIEHCALCLFPTGGPRTALQISAVYTPSSSTRSITMELLRKLSRQQRNPVGAEPLPHLLIGDFNITSWSLLYHEWLKSAGARELLDPTAPTFALGTSIDKLTFVPGSYVPSTFLPPSHDQSPDMTPFSDEPYCPAIVLGCDYLGSHYPSVLPIPCDFEE